jgi:hypothetical protein
MIVSALGCKSLTVFSPGSFTAAFDSSQPLNKANAIDKNKYAAKDAGTRDNLRCLLFTLI